MSWDSGSLVRKIDAYREFRAEEVRSYINYSVMGVHLEEVISHDIREKCRQLSLKYIKKFEEIRIKHKLPLRKKLRKTRPIAGIELAKLVENYDSESYRICADWWARFGGAYI